MLQTCCIVWAHVLVARSLTEDRGLTVVRALGVSALAGLAGLTRMDSAALLLPAGLACAMMARLRLKTWLALLFPVALLIGPWLAWKLSYYGGILPNTFAAKLGASLTPERGVWYLVLFAFVYALPVLAIAHLRERPLQHLRSTRGYVWCLLVPIAVWSSYIVYSGGDFMEFRFLIALSPFIMLLLAAPMALVRVRTVGVMLAVYVGASSFHGAFFEKMPWYRAIEGIPQLGHHPTDPRDGWLQLGESLNEDVGWTLETDNPVRFALMPAGAIAWTSSLPVDDKFGLNDADVAREGVPLTERAGHRKVSTIAMLLEKEVHLAITHPKIFDPSMLDESGLFKMEELHKLYMLRRVPDPSQFPAGTRIVAMPNRPGEADLKIIAIYLTPHPAVDELIERGAWDVYTVDLSEVDDEGS